jgi:LacI family transcriptional regulator
MSKTPMKAVALKAGVSIATVSRVLGNKDYVAEDKRKAVLEAMRSLGYAKRQKDAIGLIVPDSSNPFFAQLGFMFERALESERPRKHLLTSSSESRADKELELIERFKRFGVEGLIYIPSGKSSETILRLVADEQISTVVFDRRIPAGLDFVAVNSRQGTLSAVDYLITHGHSRIAYLKGKEDTETAKERYDSFLEAMKRNHIEINQNWVFSGDYTPASGRTCAEFLIRIPESQRPTALLAANDVMAIAAMQHLQKMNWILPKMLSVVGFDDIEWSKWCYPALTTIAQPIPKLVLEALKLLKKRIREREDGKTLSSPPLHVEIEPVLIPRDSVTAPFDYGAPSKLRVVSADAVTTWRK